MNNIVTIPLTKTPPSDHREIGNRRLVAGDTAELAAVKAEGVPNNTRHDPSEDIEDLWDNLPV